MALSDAALVVAGNSLASAITHISLSTASPGTTGTNQSAAARQAVTWNVDADGDLTLTAAANFTGGASNGAVHSVCFWSASTGGTFYGSYQLTGDTTFNAAGEYTVTQVTLNAVSS